MSKKLASPANSNTLFKYFQKSPATPKTPVIAASASKDKENGDSFTTPKSLFKKTEKRPSVTVTPKTPQDDDDEIVHKTKRRRILEICDSDEDSDRENEDQNGANDSECDVSIPEKKPRLSQFESQPSTPTSSSAKKTPASVKKTEIKKDIKSEPKSPTADASVLMDEETVWTHNKIDFIKPEQIRDGKGRRPDHPDYDSRTLLVPESFLNKQTPGHRQWWDLKSKHYDCVLFFKVGKFYELYHMDASVGVKELGFTYMRGEFAHSGFPESAYARMATALVERGYKVARVEQTETPDMMTERCKKQKHVTKFDRVVKREICQITNKGTQVYGQQVQLTLQHEPNYMLALVEKSTTQFSRYGVCFIDTSIGDFHIGEFDDDKQNSRLLTLLAHNPPVLVLVERSGLSLSTASIIKTKLAGAIRETLAPKNEMWTAQMTLKTLSEKYFNGNWPTTLKLMQDNSDTLGLTPSDEYSLAIRALGGCVWYLTKNYLDQQVLSLARFNSYIPPDVIVIDDDKKSSITEETPKSSSPKFNRHMVIDAITIANLRITGEQHSLQSTIDYCCTKFGKRLLHYWLCAPSCDVNVIRERQAAAMELLENVELFQDLRQILGGLPDLERQLAQIHAFGNKELFKNHPNGRAILFEELMYGKKKINDFVSTLNGFEACMKITKMLKNCESTLLMQITQLEPKGQFPDMDELIEFFNSAFNHEEAKKDGIIAPGHGVDAEYDVIQDDIEEVNKELKEYLMHQEKHFGCKLSYFGNDKKRFQIEVPEAYTKKANSSYMLEKQVKGSKPCRRYFTDETKAFLKQMIAVEDRRNSVLKDLSRRIFEKFSKHYNVWKKCVDLVGMLDVLGSFAEYARNQGNTCVPEIVEGNIEGKPLFEIEDGFHPCMNSAEFIPNSITLGHPNAPLAILTGPNMGGKSTLMRQVGLLAILTQIGCPVPADKCRMSLIDRIFTRLGAQDDIIGGQSTFLVELNETSAILKHSTVNSLVLLDELGRGTATYDGSAIAAAVVNFLADLKCRTLFSTHYHSLVDNFQADARITLGHMACMVENEDHEDVTEETVTFLYKYTDGPCPKSYGFNAAKLAGMPKEVIRHAYELARKVERDALKRRIFAKIITKTPDIADLKTILNKLKSCAIK